MLRQTIKQALNVEFDKDMIIIKKDDRMITKIEVLKQYSFYRNAEKILQDEIVENANLTQLEPNTYFFKNGDKCHHIALLGAGSVRVFVVGESGREVTLYHVGPGDSCPINILSAMHDMEIPAMALAESHLSAVVIPVHVFKKWHASYESIQHFILEALASRLFNVLSLMEEIKFRKLEHRLADYLLTLFEQSDNNPPTAQVTHEKIAIELGSAREVISRLLREFEKKGTVSLARGKISQLNKEALYKILLN